MHRSDMMHRLHFRWEVLGARVSLHVSASPIPTSSLQYHPAAASTSSVPESSLSETWLYSGSLWHFCSTWSWPSRCCSWSPSWNRPRETILFVSIFWPLPPVPLRVSRWKRILNWPFFGSIQPAWTTLFYATLLILIVLFAGELLCGQYALTTLSFCIHVRVGGLLCLLQTCKHDCRIQTDNCQCRCQ